MTETGTIDNPAALPEVTRYYIDTTGDIPSLVLNVDIPRGLGGRVRWTYDSVIGVYYDDEDKVSVSILCYPDDDDDGWYRLDDVGEW